MVDESPRPRERSVGVLSLLVLGAGLLDLFAGVLPVPFRTVWVIGFAVVVPGRGGVDAPGTDTGGRWSSDDGRATDRDRSADEDATDALETLRDRYARGELTDEQFERKLDRLLATDAPENAAEYRAGARTAAPEDRERDPEWGSSDRPFRPFNRRRATGSNRHERPKTAERLMYVSMTITERDEKDTDRTAGRNDARGLGL